MTRPSKQAEVVIYAQIPYQKFRNEISVSKGDENLNFRPNKIY